MYLISHMRLEIKFGRRAKSCWEHLHEPLSITPRVQTVHSILYDVETFVARRLQVVFSRQVGPQGPVQTGMVSQITALIEWKEKVNIRGKLESSCGLKKNYCSHLKCKNLKPKSMKNAKNVLSLYDNLNQTITNDPTGLRIHKQQSWLMINFVIFTLHESFGYKMWETRECLEAQANNFKRSISKNSVYRISSKALNLLWIKTKLFENFLTLFEPIVYNLLK